MSCDSNIKNCDECTGPETNVVCTKCTLPFILSKNSCKECQVWVPNCLNCNNNKDSVECTKCISQFFVDSTKKCKLCSDVVPNCKNCQGLAWEDETNAEAECT